MQQLNPAVGSDAGLEMIPAKIEAFSNLVDDWKLSTEEQIRLLGSPGRSTFFKWKKEGGNLPNDTIEQISHLLEIHMYLQILFPNPMSADSWIKRPNKYFGDISALAHDRR